ncbi:MAG: Gfo/Idh/MocA family oxidoreductase, partial [Planctomycetes bacterium]|nr:Gfo/Idh/MocA family oxidoreductase [Planctomycetota bacterium]
MNMCSSTPLERFTRRTVLRRAAGMAAAAAAPLFLPASVFGARAPSNRINVACIGTGNQGIGILRRFLPNDDVQIVAVCDVNRGSFGYKTKDQFLGREPAREEVNTYYAQRAKAGTYAGCQPYVDFQEVLARDDVDAVTIVVPDHWHAIMTIQAAEKRKDIYCEKPLSLTVRQGRAMVAAVRKHGRILQTGSMQRSNPLNRHVSEVVQAGRIGRVQRVTAVLAPNNMVGPGPGWQPMPVPDGFDYPTWLGPAPDAPYHQDRCLYRFRFNYDYSGGQVTNFGAHSNDLAQWGLGTDHTGPLEIEYVRATWLPEGSLFTTALETEFRCRYADGAVLTCKTTDTPQGVGVRFEGSEGMIEAFGYPWTARSQPASLVTDKFPTGKFAIDETAAHVRNFIDCVKTR